MARLPEVVIEQIKTDISLLRLVESQGYQPKRQGKDYAINCPFHPGDDTPSLIISPASNLFNCFGCGAAGSVIDWVMKTRGVSFRFACELLQKDLGRVAESGITTVKRNTTTKLAAPLNADADDQTALRQVIDYYHQTLKQAPEGLAYLEQRGLNSAELIDRFKLGFANRTLGYGLPAKNRKAGAEIRQRLQNVGILRASGHEHFNGSLVVPVMDGEGRIREVYGRKIRDDLRKGTAKHLYLPGAHQGVWNIEAVERGQEIILCEALIDAMTFWVHGFKNVTASFGTGGWTADHLAAFKRHGVERVLIAYDRDEAGNQAAETLAKKLCAEGFECFRVLLPKGMDVNEYALQVRPAPKSLGLAIRKAEWMGTGRAPARRFDQERQTGVAEKSLRVSPAKTPGVDATPAGTESAGAEHVEPKRVEPKSHVPKTPPPDDLPDTHSSPLPSPPETVEAECGEHEITITQGDRFYRVRGLENNSGYDQLKIQLLVKRGDAFHTDKLDLYASKQRQVFINQASVELGVKDAVIKTDLGQVLLKLEGLQQQRQQPDREARRQPALNDREQAEALALLEDASLLSRILADFERAGVVGEETNKLVGYLACVSRKLSRPLALMIQSSSAAGKSSLMEAILALMPEEERVQYSAMTGQSLFYMGETNLKHKILAIAEEEGATSASYALKLLQSEGEVTIASTGKDDNSGTLVTREYKVEGPVMLFLTTTAIDIDEELLNRCLVLSVNEGREQTQAIHAAQRRRRTLAGLQARLEKEAIIALHRNAQRLLKPLAVINPYADRLTFLDDKTRTRRDHEKYLTLIDSIALLHQYQREMKRIDHNGEAIDYIEVTLADIEAANRLAHEVLGKTLDELPPQTRRLLSLIQAMVKAACERQGIETSHYRFSRKSIRQQTGWGNTQLKVHCKRLEEMEYLLVHRGGRGQSIEYELLYDGDLDAPPHLVGLIEVETLRYDHKKSGVNAEQSGSSRGQVGPKSGGGRPPEKPLAPRAGGGCGETGSDRAENARPGCVKMAPNRTDRGRTDSAVVRERTSEAEA